MSHTGIVLSPTVEVFPSRRRGKAICTLDSGYRVSVLERSAKWCGIEVVRTTADGSETINGFVDASCLALADPDGRGHLAADLGLQSADVEPPAKARLGGAQTAQEVAVSRVWNLYGGLLSVLADRIGIDPAYAVAVVCVESGGQGFGPDGRVVIRFENHIFRRYLGGGGQAAFNRHFHIAGPQSWVGHTFRKATNQPWLSFHGSQALEWQAFEVASGIDPYAAACSISMGLPQVMGFNHSLVGYATPQALLAFMGADIRFQILGMFDFIAGPGGGGQGVLALRAGDFDRFATLYNGPGQAQYYGDLIEAHVQAFRRLKPARGTSKSTTQSHTMTKGTVSPKRPSGGGSGTYAVSPGDSLGVIAGRFGVSVADLAAANGIANPNLIYVGQVLTIPGAEPAPPPVIVPSAPLEDIVVEDDGEETSQPGHTYVVRPGDTLGLIATRAGTTVAHLVELNGIANPNLIYPGQALRTPSLIA